MGVSRDLIILFLMIVHASAVTFEFMIVIEILFLLKLVYYVKVQ